MSAELQKVATWPEIPWQLREAITGLQEPDSRVLERRKRYLVKVANRYNLPLRVHWLIEEATDTSRGVR